MAAPRACPHRACGAEAIPCPQWEAGGSSLRHPCLSPAILQPPRTPAAEEAGDKRKPPAWHRSRLRGGHPASPCASSVRSGPARPASVQGALTGPQNCREVKNSPEARWTARGRPVPFHSPAQHPTDRVPATCRRAREGAARSSWAGDESHDACGGHCTPLARAVWRGGSLPAHYHSVHCSRIPRLFPQILGSGTPQALYEKEIKAITELRLLLLIPSDIREERRGLGRH